jgi:hypothetical protein
MLILISKYTKLSNMYELGKFIFARYEQAISFQELKLN